MNALYVDTPQGLVSLSEQLRRGDWIALDTEFIRDRTYAPRLCLIQVANEHVLACVDPLALDDLAPLLDVLYDPGITKVLHAARQDLEIFYNLCDGRLPSPVFDTQIAATVLGHNEQIGYGGLVQAQLGISLEKGHTRTDWCRRPLSNEQLKYAADDVRYLCEIYQGQLAELEESGRAAWLAEDFEELTEPRLYASPPQYAWQKIKGAGRLKKQQLAVLQQLAAWREERARDSDKPRRWVVKDEVLLDLARQMPDTLAKLAHMRGLDERTLKSHGPRLIDVIASGKRLPRDQWPQPKEGKVLPPEQEPVVDMMMAQLRILCRQNRVAAAAVAGRRDLERLALGDTDVPLMHGWRAAIAGKEIAALLSGHRSLRVIKGSVRVLEETENDV